MAFLSIIGRVLFVSVFVLSAWREMSITQLKFLVVGAIAIKAIGSFLFIFDSTIGATLLILHQLIAAPILYDYYNSDIEKKEFIQLTISFTQRLSLLGGLLFFVGMKNSIPKIDGNAYIEHMKDQLMRARVDSEIMFEQLIHTQSRLNATQEELSQCYQEITRLTRRRPSRGECVR